MRVLPFTKYSPCGNTTILVRESSLSPADRARVAAEIIAPGHLEAEQAGYVDTAAPVPRLDMMGGEFCVNATRAFAALLAEEGEKQIHFGQRTQQFRLHRDPSRVSFG